MGNKLFDGLNMENAANYLSIQEFSAISGLSVATIRRRIKDGSLSCRQLGGYRCRVLILSDALEQVSPPPNRPPSPSHASTTASKEPKLSGPKPVWQRSQTS